jgi:hypothetical protein
LFWSGTLTRLATGFCVAFWRSCPPEAAGAAWCVRTGAVDSITSSNERQQSLAFIRLSQI